jgi:O-antigen/teichoic acid export membrane protein
MSRDDAAPKASGIKRLFEDVAGTFGTRMITMAFGVFTGIITARALGPENRGIFALVVLLPASFVTLSKFGQGVASVYFIRREKEEVSQVASNVLLFAVCVSVVLVTIALMFREQLLDSFLRGVPGWALVAVMPLIPILLVESYLYGVLQATDRFRVYNTRLLCEAVFTLAGMAVALLFLKAGLEGALAVAVGVRLVMASWVVLTVHRGSPLRLRFDVPLFRRMIRYGLKSHVQIIASHFHFKAGVYLVAYFLSPAQVAFYVIASRLAEHILWLPQSLGMALFPRLAGSDPQQAHRMTASAVRQSLFLTAAVAAVLAVSGRFLITTWYGAEYEPAARPLMIACAGIVMMSMFVLLSRNFTSRNKQGMNIVAAYTALGGNLALNVVLVPRYGITGAAVATAISYTAAAMLLFVFFLKDSKLPWHEVLIVRRADIERWWRLAQDFRSGMRPAKA